MSTTTTVSRAPRAPAVPVKNVQVIAWIVTLLASGLPSILLAELAHQNTAWLLWARLVFLAGLVAASFAVSVLRPLRSYFIVIAAVYLLEELMSLAAASPAWVALFGSGGAPFATDMLGNQLKRLGVSLLMIVVLLALRYKPWQFFLRVGDLRALIQPVRWLAFPKPVPWTNFGGQWAAYISLGTLAFLFIAGRPQLSQLARALPILPVVLLLAAMNAFNEEMTYRASFLATSEAAVGPRSAGLMAAAFFGIGHYYGVPYGIAGVILATFLGWMLGKAMLETRGFFWAWFIHFLQDVAIFSFMAVGSITPGG